MHFHLEPECSLFELPSGRELEIVGTYDLEPISIRYSEDTEYGVFGAIFPGDGSVSLRVG